MRSTLLMNRNKHNRQRFFCFYKLPLPSIFLLLSLPCCCSGVHDVCKLCQQTSPKCWFANVNMTSYCDVTNSVYPLTITTIGLRHCSILEFGRGASNQAVALGITRPLHATDRMINFYWKLCTRLYNFLFCCFMILGLQFQITLQKDQKFREVYGVSFILFMYEICIYCL